MRVLLMGVPASSSNRGVLALASSLILLIREALPDADIALLIGHSRHTSLPIRTGKEILQIPVIPCRLSPRSAVRDHLCWIVVVAVLYRLTPWRAVRTRVAGLAPWVKALSEADFVGDIRGGDSFSDIYGAGRFTYGSVLACVVLLVRGSIVQLPQTFGPYRTQPARAFARFILRHSTLVCARDAESERLATELIGRADKVVFCPDVAFSLPAIAPPGSVCGQSLADDAQVRFIGVNINGLLYHGGYTRRNMFGLGFDYRDFAVRLLTALLEEQEGDVLLVPHTLEPAGDVESDPEASELVRSALPLALQRRVKIVCGNLDQHELKFIIGRSDFFVGSRMHACIAALSQGVPCVGVAYSRKFAGVFDSLGMRDWIVDGRTPGVERAVSRVMELYRQRHTVRQHLSTCAVRTRSQLRQRFHQMLLAS